MVRTHRERGLHLKGPDGRPREGCPPNHHRTEEWAGLEGNLKSYAMKKKKGGDDNYLNSGSDGIAMEIVGEEGIPGIPGIPDILFISSLASSCSRGRMEGRERSLL